MDMKGSGSHVVLYRYDTIAVLKKMLENGKLGLFDFAGISLIRIALLHYAQSLPGHGHLPRLGHSR